MLIVPRHRVTLDTIVRISTFTFSESWRHFTTRDNLNAVLNLTVKYHPFSVLPWNIRWRARSRLFESSYFLEMFILIYISCILSCIHFIYYTVRCIRFNTDWWRPPRIRRRRSRWGWPSQCSGWPGAACWRLRWVAPRAISSPSGLGTLSLLSPAWGLELQTKVKRRFAKISQSQSIGTLAQRS